MTTVHLNKEFLIPGKEYGYCYLSKGYSIGSRWSLSIELEDEIEVCRGDLLTVSSLEEIESREFYSEPTTSYELVTVVFRATEIRYSESGNRFVTWETND